MTVKSVRKLAPYIGISHTALNKKLAEGSFKAQPDGTYDVEIVREALRAHNSVTHTSQSKIPSVDPQSSHATYNKAKAHREITKAKLDELDLKQRQGELVRISDVMEFETKLIATCKTELQLIGPELADDLAACADPDRCKRMVSDRIDQALRKLASYGENVQAA